jgi:hypothetical protein
MIEDVSNPHSNLSMWDGIYIDIELFLSDSEERRGFTFRH